MIRNLCIN